MEMEKWYGLDTVIELNIKSVKIRKGRIRDKVQVTFQLVHIQKWALF
jgi:hypothetical protein